MSQGFTRENAPFDATAPTTIQADDAASAGSASTAARRDHKHAIVCDTPQSLTVGDANTEGSSTGFARGDHKHGFGTAWTNWTPTVKQNGTRTITVNTAKYCVLGKICFVEANLTITNTGTAGNTLEISNPPQSVLYNDMPAGNFFYSDVSTSTQYIGSMQTHTTVGFYFTIDGTTNQFGVAPSLAVDTNDTLRFSGWYEIA